MTRIVIRVALLTASVLLFAGCYATVEPRPTVPSGAHYTGCYVDGIWFANCYLGRDGYYWYYRPRYRRHFRGPHKRRYHRHYRRHKPVPRYRRKAPPPRRYRRPAPTRHYRHRVPPAGQYRHRAPPARKYRRHRAPPAKKRQPDNRRGGRHPKS